MAFRNLTLADRGAVRTLTINRPEALNALSGAVIDELIAAVEAIADDAAIRGVVITGAGPKSFVAGADIAAMAPMSPSEAMNFAGVYDLPLIFIVQNNQFAISHPRRKQTKSRTLAQKALAYGFEGVQVDGNDVLAVYSATCDAVAKARKGGGPTLIECVTYRLSMHTTADDPTRYREDKEVKEWEKRDPLIRFAKYLRNKGVLDDESIEGIENDIKDEIASAVKRYEEYEGLDPLDSFKYILAELPPDIRAQQDEFVAALQNEGKISH